MKKLKWIVMALVLVLGMAAFAACKPDEPETPVFTVTYYDGTTVLKTEEVEEGGYATDWEPKRAATRPIGNPKPKRAWSSPIGMSMRGSTASLTLKEKPSLPTGACMQAMSQSVPTIRAPGRSWAAGRETSSRRAPGARSSPTSICWKRRRAKTSLRSRSISMRTISSSLRRIRAG